MDRNAFFDFGSFPGHAPEAVPFDCPVPVLGVLLARASPVGMQRTVRELAFLHFGMAPATAVEALFADRSAAVQVQGLEPRL